MKSLPLIALLLTAAAVLAPGCRSGAASQDAEAPAAIARARFIAGIDALEGALGHLDTALHSSGDSASGRGRSRAAFVAARRAYKRIEFLAEHYTPETAGGINGPPVNTVADDDPNQVVISPEGLQAIEEILYAPAAPTATLATEVAITRANVRRLRIYTESRALDDAGLFAAMREELIRLMTLGISGFDVAHAGSSIPEASVAVAVLRETLALYDDRGGYRGSAARTRMDSLLAGAADMLARDTSFAGFDRLRFIRAYGDPLLGALADVQRALGVPLPQGPRVLTPGAPSLFAAAAFDPMAYAPLYLDRSDARRGDGGDGDRAELGRLLFFDPVLSGNSSRACASCHQPDRAFTDGLPRSVAFGARGVVARNAPTVINAALQPRYFADGRVIYLEDQATQVLANPREMHGSLAQATATLARSTEYRDLFAAAFDAHGASAVTEGNIRVALASYIRSLVRMNAPLDRYMRGEDAALGEEARRGFNLFMGKARCGTCHFMPLFNGARPPIFTEDEQETIGVPARYDTLHPTIDPDSGRYDIYHHDIDRFAFKVPSLRNAALTAPYMHNGVFATLGQVVDFYNRGGGAGMGIDLPTQTLPAARLNLDAADQRAIVAFIVALTDTAGTQSPPRRLPEIPGAMRRLPGGLY